MKTMSPESIAPVTPETEPNDELLDELLENVTGGTGRVCPSLRGLLVAKPLAEKSEL